MLLMTYGTIFTSFTSEEEIRVLLKKLINRSVQPVDIEKIPEVIQLRNGMKVHFQAE